jgi:hypothetical protein
MRPFFFCLLSVFGIGLSVLTPRLGLRRRDDFFLALRDLAGDRPAARRHRPTTAALLRLSNFLKRPLR